MIKAKKSVLVVISLILFSQCTTNDDQVSSEEPVLDTGKEFPVLDTREDLSLLDLKSFVAENRSFKLQVADSITAMFENVIMPEIEGDEDVVYSYSDDKAYLTFSDDGIMSFIFYGDTFNLKGSIFKNTSIKEKEERRFIVEKNSLAYSKDATNKNVTNRAIILEKQDNHALIEYIPMQDYNKLYEESNGKFPLSNNNEKECVVLEKDNSFANDGVAKRSVKVPYVKIEVFHYKKTLSSSDVNWAKINARKSLESVFGSQLDSRKIKTYFDSSLESIYRLDFPKGYSLIESWAAYCSKRGMNSADKLYLLLTDDEYDDALGFAYLKGRYAWANVKGKQHTTPGHEIGHLFGAKHTKPYWDKMIGWFGWYTVDIMTTVRNNPGFHDINSNKHKSSSNKRIMRSYLSSILQ